MAVATVGVEVIDTVAMLTGVGAAFIDVCGTICVRITINAATSVCVERIRTFAKNTWTRNTFVNFRGTVRACETVVADT